MSKGNTILIIGGGFYGLYLADHFTRHGFTVRLIEKENALMIRASYANQARVHNGYHYPRSILTALRSRVSFPRFVKEFNDCIENDFEKYYFIGNPLGKVTAKQFLKFCSRIGAQCEIAPEKIRALTNPHFIETCFSVVEYAFDSTKLREVMINRLKNSNTICSLNTTATFVRQKNQGLEVDLKSKDSDSIETVYADHVFNCTYSGLNSLTTQSGINIIPLKHEMTEMCLVEVPDLIKKIGITVMCGPFFSVMPFPSARLHSFSHVRYTPHFEWQDNHSSPFMDSHLKLSSTQKHSAWAYMKKDASRYIPLLSECSYRESLWEVKTILPRSESDDSRPILFLPNHGIKGFHCIMGGKIDNVYDVVEAIQSQNVICF